MAYTIEGKHVIVLGDTTTHGGKVITGSENHSYRGIPVARVGDMVECPLCKGTYPIIEGAPKAFDHEKPIARHGDKVACGATLISRENMADVGTLYAATEPKGGGRGFQFLQGHDPRYDECFRLVDQETGMPLPDYLYAIKTESGQIVKGRTDEKGYTRRVETDGTQSIEIRVGEQDDQGETPDGVGYGNQEEGSYVDIHVIAPQLYFILYAYDTEFSFQRAAHTMQEAIENYSDFSPRRGDLIFNKGIESESDFKQ
jgi:uncharacterized Zn-binding protein involved in type VI secretion